METWDLDYILESGNDIFKNINIFRPLSVDELPNTLTIGSQLISIEMLTYYSELLDKTDIFEVHKSMTSDSNGLIFTTGGYSISLIWNKSKVFLFDSHSRDNNGLFICNGTSVLLEFKSLSEVEKYIKTEYSKHISNFNKTQYDLQYVRVDHGSNNNVSSILNSINKVRNNEQRCKQRAKLLGTLKHDR